MLAVVDAHVVYGDDVRMLKECRRGNLAPESLNDLLAGERTGQNHLQRDNPPKTELPRAIDHPHPTASYLFDEFIVAENTNRLSGGQRAAGIGYTIGYLG